LLRKGQTFVDIGANVGCISLLAAKLVGPTGTVISVEPNPTNVQRLYAGIVLNRFENVRVLPYAASDRRATFSLMGSSSNSSLTLAKSYDVQGHYVQSIVLDEELAGLPSIDFVKIDVEGYEPVALEGFSRLLRKHRPTILTEFNPRCLREIHGRAPIDYLAQLFSLSRRLRVITIFGDSVTFTDSNDLMTYWEHRDRELTAKGLLPRGMLQFDVIASDWLPAA
jgi:FkbM family methyltransferase